MQIFRGAIGRVGLLVLSLLGASGARAEPAHYLVVESTPTGLEVVHQRVVDIPGKLHGRTAAEVSAAFASRARDRLWVAARVLGPDGTSRFETVVGAPLFMHAELADGTHRFTRIARPTFVVRVPYVGGGKVDLRTAPTAPRVSFDLARAPVPPVVRSAAAPDSAQNRVDVLILGDGFTREQEALFFREAANLEARFFAVSPYREYHRFFRLRSVFTASPEAGSDHPTYDSACPFGATTCCSDAAMLGDPHNGSFVDTAFGATFCYQGIHRLIGVDFGKVYEAAANVPDWDQIMLLVNDDVFGGAGGGISVMSTNPDALEIGQHEFGHTFTGLADEYEDPYPGFPGCSDLLGPACEPNVTDATTRDLLKWADWVARDTPLPTPEGEVDGAVVGLFEGARYQPNGMYRPQQSCVMRANGEPACSVCKQAFVQRIYTGGWGQPFDGIDVIEPGTETPPQGPVYVGQGAEVAFTIEPLQPDGGPLRIVWRVADEVVQDGTSASYSAFFGAGGAVEVRVEVTDPTPLLGTGPGSFFGSERIWTVIANDCAIDLDCDDGDDCSNDGCVDPTGCVHSYNTDVCDDGLLTTNEDRCDGRGTCEGREISCAPESACVTYVPNGVDCTEVVQTGRCDDGAPCTINDACDALGTCLGEAVVCGAGESCGSDGECRPDLEVGPEPVEVGPEPVEVGPEPSDVGPEVEDDEPDASVAETGRDRGCGCSGGGLGTLGGSLLGLVLMRASSRRRARGAQRRRDADRGLAHHPLESDHAPSRAAGLGA